jgi:hypothetical protein
MVRKYHFDVNQIIASCYPQQKWVDAGEGLRLRCLNKETEVMVSILDHEIASRRLWRNVSRF